MTPFGHIGGGLVVGVVVEKVLFKEPLTPATVGIIVLLSILPDLDSALAFLFKKWRPVRQKLNHHDYFTHTPLFFILLTPLVWIGLGKEIGVLFLSVTLTHLLLDSWATDDGIKWLWPISQKKFSIFPHNLHEGGLYGVRYYSRYIRQFIVSIPEAVLFIGGVVLVFLWWK
jgi:hypothetical protein